jgi:predicted metalloprotease
MKWRGREQSSNIEDRRGQGGGLGGLGGGNPFGRGGGGIRIPTGGGGSRGGIGSLIGIVVVLGIIWVATGTNPIDILTGGSSTGSSASSSSQLPTTGEQSELRDFVGVVVKETEDVWTDVFKQSGMTYTPPKVVLFTSRTQSGCGIADANSGPFYCPEDQKVYIDLSFYDQLRRQFGAPGDFAQAYVLAHEIGHHVQNLTGVLPKFNQLRQSMSEDQANAYSVRVELQADCYAGIWANRVGQENLLDQGDVEEAITAANAIGDDTLTRGQVSSRNFTHGTSEQRMRWLQRGIDSGNPADCDTFSGQI